MPIEQETWRFINTFAPWLSAIGTLAAVVTSLYLARRRDRISLKVRVAIIWILAEGGSQDHGKEFLAVDVVNVGRRPARLTQFFWKPGPAKGYLFWMVAANEYSSSLPATLGDGESAQFLVPIEQWRQGIRDQARELWSGPVGWLRLRLTKLGVKVSTGRISWTHLHKTVRRELRTLASGS